jgi:tRNA(Ile)-lysidine synthase
LDGKRAWLNALKMIDYITNFFTDDLPNGKFLLGYSGGVDSHVLLHLMCELRRLFPTVSVRAIYVDHGLHAESAAWAEHCENVCLDLGVELLVASVDVDADSSVGLEAAARQLRYEQFLQAVEPNELLLCAHHQNDQAETLLLQSMRGSGVKGLASMPATKYFGKTQMVRPLLDISRQQIMQYAQQHHLHWVNDSSNLESQFDRNFIRHQVLPVLTERWPAAVDCLARTANHCANSQVLLDQLAQIDLGDSKPYLFFNRDIDCSLCLNDIRVLPQLRRYNLLRYWLAQHHVPMPNRKVLQSLDDLVLNTRPDAQGKLVVTADSGLSIDGGKSSSYVLQVWKNFLFIEPDIQCQCDSEQVIAWDLQDDLILPNGLGVIKAASVSSFLQADIDPARIEIRFRRGGERLQLPGETFHRCLKKCFQQWGVPPWWRERIPLLYDNGELQLVIDFSMML